MSKERRSTDSARQAVFVYVEVVRRRVKVIAVGGTAWHKVKLNTDGIIGRTEIGVGNAAISCGEKVTSGTEGER